MRPRLPTVLCVAGLTLAGCSAASEDDFASTPGGPSGQGTSQDQGTAQESQAAAAGDGLPVDALPATNRESFDECPYLDTQWVADTNGQRVTGVGVDTRFDPPACQYWSYPEEPQLTVFVRHMASPGDAMAVVDWATPIEFTSPADQPAGWNGGRHGGGEVPGRIGAAYSVAKGHDAVTVFTNQDESIKAQLVAEQVITTLGL